MEKETSLSIDGEKKWSVANFLHFLDHQIYSQGTGLLKLSLYPSEGLAWSQLEACKCPSDIFHLLEEVSISEEFALQKFLFALEAIGGSLRGKFCAEEARKRLHQSKFPSPLEFPIQTKQFQFFHWLVKVARKMPDKARRKMIKHFSNHQSIRSNPQRFETIPELFVVLYQLKIITEHDSKALELELERCKRYYGKDAEERMRLDKCQGYLVSFHSQQPKDPFSTGDEKSNATSLEESTNAGMFVFSFVHHYKINTDGSESDGGTATSGKQKKIWSEKRNVPLLIDDSDDEWTDHTLVSSPHSHATSGSSRSSSRKRLHRGFSNTPVKTNLGTSFTSETERANEMALLGKTSNGTSNRENQALSTAPVSTGITATTTQEKRDEEVTTCTEPMGKKTSGITLVVLSLLLLVGIVLSSIYVWSPISNTFGYELQQREHNVPVLGQFSAFLTQRIYVQQRVLHNDSPHRIYVFMTRDNCHNLATNMTKLHYDEMSSQNSINPVYMLEGSNISGTICATANQSGNYRVEVYILKGVHEYLYFDPQTYILYKSIPVGTNGKKKCTSDIIFHITDRDYYSVRFLPPTYVSLTYNLNMLVRSLNIDHLNHTSFVGTIEPDDDSEVIDIPIDYGTSQYCLSANIQESSNPLMENYTSILVNPEPRPAALAISVSLAVFLFLIIMVGVVVCCYCLCNDKKVHRDSRSHYEPV